MLVTLLRLLAALALLCGFTGPALAGCVTAPSTLTFAPSSSYDVQANVVAQVSGTAGLGCTGSTLSLLGGSYARATVTSLNGFKLANGGETIPYSLSADAGGTVPFQQGTTVDYMSANLISLLGIGSAGSFVAPLFAKPSAGPNIPAGTYTDVLTVNWDYSVCNGVQITPILCVGYEAGKTSTTVTITLVVGKDCRIVAPNVSFGTVALASQFTAVTRAVLVDCTRGSTYKVAFSNGQAGTARPWRAMSDGLGHSLQYNLYRADGTTIWDESNPLTVAVPGTGTTSPTQAQTYVAKVNPAQVTPPAGTYSDTVSVVISF